ncbi:sarcosine dehydrogenase, mitochondrial [Nematostella vectensis]|uniref:sarcosine dehydrogenase, mitochondrial n=1 Tax=Nematostella vectensis TaxID=45351 RepID=UPI0020770E50|nr:sarcosine dehydrogenase, mitochondrial [Nematostella vectensis]
MLTVSHFIGRKARSIERPVLGRLCRVLARWESTDATEAKPAVPYKTLQSKDSSTPSSVPAEADVVVIGGGSVGTSTLYHLTKMGVKNVILLERDKLTSGTTWHSAGLLWRLRPSDQEVEIIGHTRDLAKSLEEETGVSPGWIENGGLFIANNKERLDEYKRLMTLGHCYGIDSHVLDPKATKELYPLMNVKDLYGTLYSPGDGTIDPAGWASALTRGATKRGAKVFENCPVTGITTEVDDFGVLRVSGVDTVAGHIKTKNVVNCGGCWAPAVGAMAGVKVPLVAMHHAYIVSERIEGIQSMPNVRDHDASVYLKLQGDGLSIGGYEQNPIFWENVKKDFAFSLFDLDWDVFSVHIEGACNRVPVIAETGVKSTVCGPESFTSDHKPLMGEAPELRGFYLGCGFNSAGIMLAGGCGRELAKWVVNGHPELDMYGYDIRRFHSSITGNQKWLSERSHEAYAKNYSMVFPHDEPLAGRNMRCDPFHQVLLDNGCVYQERHGWERPGWFKPDSKPQLKDYDFYGSYDRPRHEDYLYKDLLSQEYTFDFPPHHDIIGAEAKACRSNAAVFNMSYFAKYYISGPDAQKAVDWIFTANMQKKPGSVTYTCMCNKDGGVEADLTVSVLEPGDGSTAALPHFDGNGFYVAIGGGVGQHSYSHLTNVIAEKGFDVKLEEVTNDLGMLSVQGPKSREILSKLTDADLSDEAFSFSTHKMINIAGHPVRALRLTFVGELGWELHIPRDSCVPVYRAVMEAGREHGIVNAGYRAIDSLSAEKGYKHWHQDLRHDDTPLEAGLGFTCKLKKDTPFLGREALEKQKAEGIKKRLVCFTLDQHKALLGLEAIRRNGEVCGFIRRGDWGFAIDKSIAYGYVYDPSGKPVTNEFIKSGSYTLESRGEIFSVEAILGAPFDPKNLRVKGQYDKSSVFSEKAASK